jgi:hypothetical protein
LMLLFVVVGTIGISLTRTRNASMNIRRHHNTFEKYDCNFNRHPIQRRREGQHLRFAITNFVGDVRVGDVQGAN